MIIAQISDTHITQVGGKADRKYATATHLQRAVAHLTRLPAPPAVVLVSGDCVDSGSVPEYERFRDLLRPLTMPVYVIPGNHDDRVHLQDAFGTQGTKSMAGFVQYAVDEWPVRLIALDTHIPGHHAGALCAERLRWLEERLSEAPARPTIIILHHPPFPTGLQVFDQRELEGAEAFGAMVARYPNIERVVAGHIHCAMQRRFYGTLAMRCPSTADQMFLDLQRVERLAVVMEPPACLLHVWRETTGFVTYTSLIGEYGPVTEIREGGKSLPQTERPEDAVV
jgi:3',5'-cyclic AMP phosphodiesterase CpdA